MEISFRTRPDGPWRDRPWRDGTASKEKRWGEAGVEVFVRVISVSPFLA